MQAIKSLFSVVVVVAVMLMGLRVNAQVPQATIVQAGGFTVGDIRASVIYDKTNTFLNRIVITRNGYASVDFKETSTPTTFINALGQKYVVFRFSTFLNSDSALPADVKVVVTKTIEPKYGNMAWIISSPTGKFKTNISSTVKGADPVTGDLPYRWLADIR